MSVKKVSSLAVSSRLGERKRRWRDSGVSRANRAANAARSSAPTCRSEIRVPLAITEASAPLLRMGRAFRARSCVASRALVAVPGLLLGSCGQAGQPGADAARRAGRCSSVVMTPTRRDVLRREPGLLGPIGELGVSLPDDEVVELRGHPVLRLRWCGVVASGCSPPAVREIRGFMRRWRRRRRCDDGEMFAVAAAVAPGASVAASPRAATRDDRHPDRG